MGKARVVYPLLAVALVLGGCTGSPDPAALDSPSPTPPVTTEPPEDEEPDTVTVPDVVGKKVAQARRILKGVGLTVSTTRKASGKQPGTVLSQSPVAGLEVRDGRTVKLVIAKPKPPPPPPSDGGGNCHPSYTGACLDPNASDYDCAGGSGDGPKYTGRVNVVGPDEYGLDGDGDGVGCE